MYNKKQNREIKDLMKHLTYETISTDPITYVEKPTNFKIKVSKNSTPTSIYFTRGASKFTDSNSS